MMGEVEYSPVGNDPDIGVKVHVDLLKLSQDLGMIPFRLGNEPAKIDGAEAITFPYLFTANGKWVIPSTTYVFGKYYILTVSTLQKDVVTYAAADRERHDALLATIRFKADK